MTKVFNLLTIVVALVFFTACSEKVEEEVEKPSPGGDLVEAGCASCIYKMEGADGCTTAVKIDGKAYMVEGIGKDDAHSSGLCKASHNVKIEGEVKDGKFHSTSLEHVLGEGSDGSHKKKKAGDPKKAPEEDAEKEK